MAYLAEMCRLFGVSSDWLLLGKETDDASIPARCPDCQAIVTGLDNFCPNCGCSLKASPKVQYALVLKSALTSPEDNLTLYQICEEGVYKPAFSLPNQDLLGYTHKILWAGLSMTHITQPTVKLNTQEGSDDSGYESQAGRMLYFMAGSNIPIKNTLFEIQPSLLLRSDIKSMVQAEVTARVRYNRFLSGGVAYRYNDAVSLQLGAEYKNFFVGYSYDYPLSAISKASSGSHEILVGYNMKLNLAGKNKNKHKSIRIM